MSRQLAKLFYWHGASAVTYPRFFWIKALMPPSAAEFNVAVDQSFRVVRRFRITSLRSQKYVQLLIKYVNTRINGVC